MRKGHRVASEILTFFDHTTWLCLLLHVNKTAIFYYGPLVEAYVVLIAYLFNKKSQHQLTIDHSEIKSIKSNTFCNKFYLII